MGNMDNQEVVRRLKEYNKTLSRSSCTALEKQYVKEVDERGYLYGFNIREMEAARDVDSFLHDEREFRGLLKEHAPKLCEYLRRLTEFTCNTGLIRMDVRSKEFRRQSEKAKRAIGAFYIFYGAGLDMRALVYGEYRNLFYGSYLAPVIAQELFAGNEEVVGYCRDVLTSENNTAVITRDVIIAIEQSHNKELHALLTNLFLAAKLQEGLRQSVAETADENNLEYFLELLDVIDKENLLRFSSIQRAVLTWIGLGYEEAKEKDVRYIFGKMRLFLKDESEREASLLATENPLDVYLALYGIGVHDVEEAVLRAKALLGNNRRFVVASALIYLRMTHCFEIREHLDFFDKFADDEWIMALFFAECSQKTCGGWKLSREEALLLYRKTLEFLAANGAKKEYHSQGFSWFYVQIGKENLCHILYGIIESFPEPELVEGYLPYVASTLYYSRLETFMEKYFRRASEEKRKEFLLKAIIASNEKLQEWAEKEYKALELSKKDVDALAGKLKTKKASARGHIVNVLAAQEKEHVLDVYHRLSESSVKTIRESAIELRRKAGGCFLDEPETDATGFGNPAVDGGDVQNLPTSAQAVQTSSKQGGLAEGASVADRRATPPWALLGSVKIQGKESGYGLYAPDAVSELPYESHVATKKKGLVIKKEALELSGLFPWDKRKVSEYLALWGRRITEHENDEYDAGHEFRQVKDNRFWPVNREKKGLSALPLSDVWRAYFAEDELNADEMFEIRFLLESEHDNVYLEKMLDVPDEMFTIDSKDAKACAYFGHFETIFSHYWQERKEAGEPVDGGMPAGEPVDGEARTDVSAGISGFAECWFEKALTLLELVNTHHKSTTYQRKGYRDVMETHSVAGIRSITFLRGLLDLTQADEEHFRRAFPLELQLYAQYNLKCAESAGSKPVIAPLVLARAYTLGMIPVEVVYEGILDTHYDPASRNPYVYGANRAHQLFESFRDAYFEGKGIWGRPKLFLEGYHHIRANCKSEVYETLRNILDTIINTLLAMESGRLNEQTAVTNLVENLTVVRGVEHLILALQVLEGEEFRRQTYGVHDRCAVFSNVIRHCYPAGGQDLASGQEAAGGRKPETGLEVAAGGQNPAGSQADRERLRDAHFSERRLVETAMLAPQWIDVVNDVLSWDGFKEGCYYFMAHMKQYDYVQKKAEIARFTELEPEELNDGAFDMAWCREVYRRLGEKRFKLLYQSAKFLCDNSFHTRARKYADACLGKVGKEEWRAQAEEKRNKDALNAYCICPLEDDKDLLERYLYVQRFVKETKQFGSQRQASEKRAAEMAVLNLARNSRFETVTRLSWMMESELVGQNAWALSPQRPGPLENGERPPAQDAIGGKDAGNVSEYEFWIEIDEQGDNEICVRKNGKKQKSIPAAFKKDETVLKLKEIHSQWKEQYRRSRKMLEQAMEERTAFSAEELGAMWKNPVVSPMLAKLVLICARGGAESRDLANAHGNRDESIKAENLACNVKIGLYEELEKDGLAGEIRIAHPYDLYERDCWHAWQKRIFEEKIVQPFKQVFRELYLKLEDERETSVSNRYSGYQIQPKKAAAVLKGRKWNVSYENGLERIYYKENLVVNLFAEADWFSPGDIEAPAIDYVEFFGRKDGKRVPIKDVDDVVFSETMRDLDLAVSTSYVGGVDPVTSFSTVELRATIAEYTCRLMKLDNVTVEGHFANIKGGLNDYSVHLGSGTVRQGGGAAIHILPVHSQKRGKVYLPFLDEDPKAAEVLSKIILLAEDGKIKDPSILDQIRTREK